MKITRVWAKPDPSKVREFADDVRDGKFVLPIGRRMPLRDAAEAHLLERREAALGRSSYWRLAWQICLSRILAARRDEAAAHVIGKLAAPLDGCFA